MKRREFLVLAHTGIALAAAGCVAGARFAIAAGTESGPAGAFGATTVDEALRRLYGSSDATRTENVVIEVPVFAESGAMVPIAVSTRLPSVESIDVLVVGNPAPLAASFAFGPGVDTYVSTRIWVAKTSDIVVCVRSAGRSYVNSSDVVVTGFDGCVLHELPD